MSFLDGRGSSQYKTGQLVWAKLKGYPFWPARVADPSEKPDMKRPRKKNCFCVEFFGTGDYAFVPTDDMRPYFTFKDKMTPSSKKSNFVQALGHVEIYIQKNPDVKEMELEFKTISDDERYKQWVRETRDDDTASEMSDELYGDQKIVKKPRMMEKVPMLMKTATPPMKNIFSENGVPMTVSVTKVKNGLSSETATDLESTSSATISIEPNSVKPLEKRIGFIGLGTIGSVLVQRLLSSGHDLLLCSRSIKEPELKDACQFVNTPKEVAEQCDIIFSCISDCNDAREIICDPKTGILDQITTEKGYVELSTLDMGTVLELQKLIAERGGRYLDAPLCGTVQDAKEGKLTILCSGDRSLFQELFSCLQATVSKTFFLGAAGNATKVRTALQLLHGTVKAGVAETMAFAERSGLDLNNFSEILEQTSNSWITDASKRICEDIYMPPGIKLGTMQKEMQYAINVAGSYLNQPTPIASSVNQLYCLASKNRDLEEQDCSSVFKMLSAQTALDK